MIGTLFLALLIASAALLEASPRNRREEKVQKYCLKHEDHYNKYCRDQTRMEGALHAKLAKFCPAYEKHCATDGAKAGDLDEESLVVPPPLPRGGDFAALDLPIGREAPSESKPAPAANSKLSAAMIATCVPSCTLPHCTNACKCANLFPKVHSICNPPSTSLLATICQKWYAKCPMYQPVSYY